MQDVIKLGFNLISERMGQDERQEVTHTAPPFVGAAAERISNGSGASGAAKVREVVTQSVAAAAGEVTLTCAECPGRVFGNKQALGTHRFRIHGVESAYQARLKARKKTVGAGLPCGSNGCLKTFKSARYRELHWEKAHGGELRRAVRQ
jgi:hypothetical protein